MTIAFRNPLLANALANTLGGNFNNVINSFPRVYVRPAATNVDCAPHSAHNQGFRVNTNIAESDEAFTLFIELPGVAKEDVSVSVNDERILTVAGEKKQPAAEEGAEPLSFRRNERRFGAFERRFILPKNVNTEAIGAAFENGVLELTLPKIAPSTVTVEIK
jgi:HSP20 family protein